MGASAGSAGSGDVSGEALVLADACADPVEFGLGVRRLLAVFGQAVIEVVEDGGGGGVSGQDRGRAGGDVAGPVALGPGAHEPAAVPVAAHALGHVMVNQVCRGVVPVIAAVLAQEGALL